MGESQFLQVESKSFEIAKHVSTLSITERSRSHVSSVSMGFLAARWCREALLEVANLSTAKHLFRSFRERNSVFVIQKQSNVRGAFVSITVLREYRGKGIVIIPEGRDGKGWRGVSKVIHGLLNPLVSENHDSKHRRPPTLTAQNKSNIHGESRTYKDAANRGDIPKKDLPKITHVISHVIEENIPETRDSGKAVVNGSVELYLKVVLGVGPEEKWVVKWAGIMDQPNGASVSSEDPNILFEGGPSRTGPLKVVSNDAGRKISKPNQPKQIQKLVWRPRSISSAQTSREPSPSPRTDPTPSIETVKDPENSQKALLSATLRRLGSDTENEVQIAGDANKWLLRLRDGRSLVLPAACFCKSGPMHGIDDSDHAIVPVYDGDTPEISENWNEEDSVVDSVMDSAVETYAEVEQMTPQAGEHSPLDRRAHV